jgi:hypothetical protein
MRIGSFFPCAIALLVASVTLVGCNSDSTEAPPTQIEGLPPAIGEDVIQGDDAADAHPTEGPHGGHLIELGDEEYHAELLHDEDTNTVTIHLLDGPAKKNVSVPLAEMTLQLFQDGQFVKYTLTAVPQPESPEGAASQFAVVDATLCEALSHGEELRGRLQLTIDGKPFTGTIDHAGHEED